MRELFSKRAILGLMGAGAAAAVTGGGKAAGIAIAREAARKSIQDSYIGGCDEPGQIPAPAITWDWETLMSEAEKLLFADSEAIAQAKEAAMEEWRWRSRLLLSISPSFSMARLRTKQQEANDARQSFWGFRSSLVSKYGREHHPQAQQIRRR